MPGYRTGGTVTRAQLDAWINEMNRAQEARTLGEVLAPYGLTFRAMGGVMRNAITLPTLAETEARGKIIAALEKLGHGVVYLTIAPLGEYGDERLHLVFCKEGNGYRFAAMDRIADSGKGEHRAITAGDPLYFECDCEDARGNGESCRLAKLFPLREGAYEYLAYPRERVDAHFAIETFEAMRVTDAEALPGGKAARFRLSGGYALGDLPGAPVEYILEFINALAGENGALLCDATMHYSYENYPIRLRFDLPPRLINEGDGRGFYSLDINSQYFFGDILSMPYAREIFSERLTLQAQSADRIARSAALECLRALAMDMEN